MVEEGDSCGEETVMTEAGGPISFSVWRKIAMASWRPRNDPAILATMDVDAEELRNYIGRRSSTSSLALFDRPPP